MVGKDPCKPTVLLKELYALYNLNHLRPMVANWAVNSIERACWDIMGKAAGLPLYVVASVHRSLDMMSQAWQ